MLAVLLCLGVTVLGVNGYIGGAPDLPISCDAMQPNKEVGSAHTAAPQTTPSAFQILSSSTTYQAGQQITVTLNSPNGTTFRGFLLQARPVGELGVLNGTARVGSFPTLPPNSAQTCQTNGGGSVTQTENSDKASFTITWLAPNDTSAGDISFACTFIEVRNKYWTEVLSYAVRSVTITAVTTSPQATTAVTQPNSGSLHTAPIWLVVSVLVFLTISAKRI